MHIYVIESFWLILIFIQRNNGRVAYFNILDIIWTYPTIHDTQQYIPDNKNNA